MAGQGGKARLLIVEDEPVIAAYEEDLIRDELGHVVEVLGHCMSNQQALQHIECEKPDAVLLDYGLADGVAGPTLTRLRQLGTPFVVLSGYLHEPELVGARVLLKPCSEQELIKAVREVLNLATSARRVPSGPAIGGMDLSLGRTGGLAQPTTDEEKD